MTHEQGISLPAVRNGILSFRSKGKTGTWDLAVGKGIVSELNNDTRARNFTAQEDAPM